MKRKLSAPNIVLFLLCLMYFLTYVDRVNVGTAASSIKKEFGLSNTQLGLVFSGFAYPYALFQVIGGWIGDRLGPRKTLLICGAIWAIATAMTGLATGLISLMFFRVALGFGEGATFPTATRAMQSWTPTGKRGFAQGITHSFARLGNAVTPPIVVALMIWLSWRGAFVVLGLVSMLWVIVWWLYYRDDPREHPAITPEDLALLPPPSAPKTAAKTVPWGRLIVRILPVTLTYFCYGWSLWLFLNWLPSFFLQGYKLDIKKSALFASGVFLAGVVGDALGGIISDYLFHSDPHRHARRGRLHHSGRLLARRHHVGALPFGRFFLPRARHRADLVGADGHRAAVLRHRQRTDEYRLGDRGDRLPARLRLHRRPHRQLEYPLLWFGGAAARRGGARVHHASGSEVRRQTRGAGPSRSAEARRLTETDASPRITDRG